MTDGAVWDLLLRGVVGGVLLFHAIHLLLPGPRPATRAALAVFTLALVAYLICQRMALLVQVPRPLVWMVVALCTSTTVWLWLSARALFDDTFAWDWPRLAAGAGMVALGLAANAPRLEAALESGVDPGPNALTLVHAAAMVAFTAAAVWEVLRGWRDDLVEPRRVARRWVALGIGLMVWLLIGNGTLRVYPDVARHGWAWWWASLVVIVVAHDTWFYWTHRALHHRRWFRAVHGRHHASMHPTPWAAYAFHPVEALVQAMFLPLFLVSVPVHTGVLAVFLLHIILRNTIGHCAHELFPWRWTPRGWLRWITPVSHHHFHHARNRGNYGLYFTWWDRPCGTEDPEYMRYGDGRFGSGRQAVST